MAKNIINENLFGGGGGSSLSGQTIFGAPSDGSRTNIARPDAAGSYLIPNNTYGYGLYLNELNGMPSDSLESVTITEDDGVTPLDVIRNRYSGQRDKEYLDIYNDSSYEAGCLKIYIKKTCWLLIEGTAVMTGPGGVPTQSTGIGIRRNNGTTWYSPMIAAASYTNEPAADGLALPMRSLHYYSAGTTLKIAVVTTAAIHLRRVHSASGTMSIETYFAITRVSNIASGGVSLGSGSGSTPASISLAPIGATSNVNGATISARVLNLEPASASFGGVVTAGVQQFGGDKTFTDDIIGQKTLQLPQTADAGTGVIYFGGGTHIHDYSEYPTIRNFFAGYDAGNFTGEHSYNIGIGTEAGSNLTDGSSNIIIGHGTSSLSSGTFNTLLNGGGDITTGSRNLCIGGTAPGLNYSSNESDNICINNAGVTGDQAIIRIGRSATHNACYIAGINGVPLAGTPVVVTADGQLGTGSDLGVTSLTAVGAAPNANGGTISGSDLTLQPANGTNPGLLTAGAQTIGGAKTFSGAISASNLSNTNSGDVTLATIGAVPNGSGASLSGQVLTLQPADGTNPGILTTGTQTIAGNKTFSTGVTLPTTGGTASLMNFYEATTHATTFTGAATTASLTIRLERIGNVVTMRIPLMTIAFSTTGVFNNASALPTRFRPIQVMQWPEIVQDNSTTALGRIQLTTGGGIVISASTGGANYSAGTIGWPASIVVTYPIT